VTISNFPADFFRMSQSQLETLFEKASDAFISKMYDVPIQQIQNRRSDFEIKQFGCTINRMWREEDLTQTVKEILRIVSNEYNNGNIPHTNSTPLNSEKEFLYMKATGIVRRIDDLGRVVIPKEIRRTLHIREGDPLEIYTGEDGGIILRKYSVMGDLTDFATGYAESLSKACGHPTCITDRDAVIAVAGTLRKDYMSRRISKQLENIMEDRSTVLADTGNRNMIPITEDDQKSYSSQVITPILAHGDAVGSVIILSEDSKTNMGEVEKKLTQAAAGVLGRQLEH